MYTFRDARSGDEAGVQLVVDTVLREYGMVLDTDETDRDLVDISANYTERGGAFIVLVDSADQIVGCGGLLRAAAHAAEIRKMYLLPTTRGRGLGRALLQRLIDIAHTSGVHRLTLETKSVLREAIALYERFGFTAMDHRPETPRCDRAFALDLLSRGE